MNSACPRAGLPDYDPGNFRPFRLQPSACGPGFSRMPAGLSRRDRLRLWLADSPTHADRIEFTVALLRVACVTDWSFSFRCSPPRIAATQLRFDSIRLFTASKRTSTALFPGLLRRTSRRRKAADSAVPSAASRRRLPSSCRQTYRFRVAYATGNLYVIKSCKRTSVGTFHPLANRPHTRGGLRRRNPPPHGGGY